MFYVVFGYLVVGWLVVDIVLGLRVRSFWLTCWIALIWLVLMFGG